MAGNYVLLETIELTQSAASVTFDNIPQSGYTDLKVVMSGRGDYNGPWTNCSIAINGSTSNFSQKFIYGNGSGSASSFSRTDNLNFAFINCATSTSNTYSNEEFYFPNYTSNQYKSFSVDKVAETNDTEAYIHLNAGLWSNPAAITSIAFTSQNGNYVAGSTFSLYGIAAVGTTPVIAPKATGGNIVANDGTYWYHAFLSSGTFTPQTALTCDALVVAGGGGGGGESSSNAGAGGGGAGGYRLLTSQSVASDTNYTVTIGAGGVGAIAGQNNGTAGSNSVFSTITSTGGGFGATRNVSGGNGGSGGGSGLGSGSGGTGNTPSTSPSQGNNGGVGTGTSSGGGGGGAGAAGLNAPANITGGNGGAGSNSASTWASATGTGVSGYFAGGGGGGGVTIGTGGSGGGGNGGSNSNGVAGTASTGSGGGGAYDQSSSGRTGGAGGSGIIIIRYAMV